MRRGLRLCISHRLDNSCNRRILVVVSGEHRRQKSPGSWHGTVLGRAELPHSVTTADIFAIAFWVATRESRPATTMAAYGEDDDDLNAYIQTLPAAALSVELVEVFRTPDNKSRVFRRPFSMLDPLAEHLTKPVILPQIRCYWSSGRCLLLHQVSDSQNLRVLCVLPHPYPRFLRLTISYHHSI
jgi:hypothetical protein